MGEGLQRVPDADPDGLVAGGGARLPRAEPHPPRDVLRASAGAADVQAAADGLRLRQVLPDCAVLPRRGGARGPQPWRVLPARHRDELRDAGRDLRGRRGRGLGDVQEVLDVGVQFDAVAAHQVPRRDDGLRLRQARPPQPAQMDRHERILREGRLQGVRGVRSERRACEGAPRQGDRRRGDEDVVRQARGVRQGERRQGPRLHQLDEGERAEGPDCEVPQRRTARGDEGARRDGAGRCALLHGRARRRVPPPLRAGQDRHCRPHDERHPREGMLQVLLDRRLPVLREGPRDGKDHLLAQSVLDAAGRSGGS